MRGYEALKFKRDNLHPKGGTAHCVTLKTAAYVGFYSVKCRIAHPILWCDYFVHFSALPVAASDVR